MRALMARSVRNGWSGAIGGAAGGGRAAQPADRVLEVSGEEDVGSPRFDALRIHLDFAFMFAARVPEDVDLIPVPDQRAKRRPSAKAEAPGEEPLEAERDDHTGLEPGEAVLGLREG